MVEREPELYVLVRRQLEPELEGRCIEEVEVVKVVVRVRVLVPQQVRRIEALA